MEQFLSVLDQCRTKLNDHRDPYVQGDAATDAFDGWRAEAAAYARQFDDEPAHGGPAAAARLLRVSALALGFLACDQQPSLLTNAHTDDYVTRNLMQSFAQILSLLRGKPKLFAAVRRGATVPPLAPAGPDDDSATGQFLKELVDRLAPRLVAATLNAGTPVALRIHYLSGLRALVEFANALLGDADESKLAAALVDAVPLDACLTVAVNSRLDSVHRHAAERLLAAFAATPGRDTRQRIAMELARRAVDAQSLELLWSQYAGITNLQAIAVLVGRVRAGAARDQQRASADRGTGQNMEALPLQLLNSLSQSINNGSLGGGAERAPDDASAAPSSGAAAMAPQAIGAVLELARACDSAATNVYRESSLSSVPDAADGTGRAAAPPAASNERCPEMVELLGALLRQFPDHAQVLDLALDPPSVECVALVQSASAGFSEQTWLGQLLPYLNGRVNGFSLHGVSGEPLEQELVNFVRECARVYYINRDHVPSLQLGAALFAAMLNAMRHGYVETERFPMLCAAVVRFHIADPAFDDQQLAEWARQALTAGAPATAVQARPAAAVYARAVRDVFVRLFGLSDDDDGVDAAPLNAEQAERLARALAFAVTQRAAAPAALTVWSTLCATSSRWLLCLPVAALDALLTALRARVDAMREAREPRNQHLLDGAANVVRELCALCAPAHAASVFALSVDVLSVASTSGKRAPVVPGPQDDRRGGASALGAGGADDTLSRVLRKVPISQAHQLSRTAVLEALAHGGPRTREALAVHVPELCLGDSAPAVRAAALLALTHRSDLLPGLAEQIFAAMRGHTADENALTDRGLQLGQLDVLLAGAMCVARLAILRSSCLADALDLLLTAARISALNDARQHVSPAILDALRVLAAGKSSLELAQLAALPTGCALLAKAAKVSADWANVRQRLVNDQYILLGDNDDAATELTQPVGRRRKPKKSSKSRKQSAGSAPTVAAAASTAGTTSPSATSKNSQKTSKRWSLTGSTTGSDVMPDFVVNSKKLSEMATGRPADGDDGQANGPAGQAAADALLKQIDEALERREPMAAVRLSHQLRSMHRDQFDARGHAVLCDRVLPMVGSVCLPAVSSDGLAAEHLETGPFNRLLALMREIQSLFYADAEAVLQLSRRLADLCESAVKMRLRREGVAATRAWIQEQRLDGPYPFLVELCNIATNIDELSLLPPVEQHELLPGATAAQTRAPSQPQPLLNM